MLTACLSFSKEETVSQTEIKQIMNWKKKYSEYVKI